MTIINDNGVEINMIEVKELSDRCVVCLESNGNIFHKCIRCNECNICIDCILMMQEHGKVQNCPVCRKPSPWCKNIKPEEVENKLRIYENPIINQFCRRTFYLVFTIVVMWCIGFSYITLNGGVIKQINSNIIVSIMLYIIIGVLVTFITTLCVLLITLCFIACLKLSINHE